MECNVGGTDRTLRMVAGTALLGAGLFAPMGKALRLPALALSGIALGTAITRYCPANSMLGIDTSPQGA